MTTQRRVTQKDVARAAGTDQSTVSLALRDHPRISRETREHITAIARQLGYYPDPMLSALASYRSQHRAADFHGTIAWLADSRHGMRWRENAHISGFYAAAVRYAETLGYKVEVFDLRDLNVNWIRAARIARARGVQGLLVCPQPEPGARLDNFPWESFSSVNVGHSLSEPHLNAVSAGYRQIMSRIVDELLLRGYQRIGLALRPVHDQRTGYGHSAGFLVSHHRHQIATVLPICPDDGLYSDGSVLRKWLDVHQPDALIAGGNPRLHELLREWGIDVPGELGVACPVLLDKNDSLSGVLEDIEEIGRVSVEILVSAMQRGVRGVPAVPKLVQVDGIWCPGETIRPLP